MIYRRGITLVELMIAFAIFAVTYLLCLGLLRLLNSTSRQKALIEAQKMAQIVFYDIGKDVRNAQRILYVHDDELALKSFDYAAYKSHPAMEVIGYVPYNAWGPKNFSAPPHFHSLNSNPWNPVTLDPTALVQWTAMYNDIGQIKDATPMLREVNIGTVTYRYQAPLGQDHYIERIDEFPGRRNRTILLKNVFDFQPGVDQLFKPVPEGGSTIQGVEISLRIQFRQLGGASYTYKSQAVMRGEGVLPPP
jgi:hypothetical protein